MKTRIEMTFETLRQAGKKALIPYIMAGDPCPDVTVDLMHKLVEHGADIIEVGLPLATRWQMVPSLPMLPKGHWR